MIPLHFDVSAFRRCLRILRCPVWDDCFEASFSLVEPFVGEEEGIWAGLTKADRERFRNEPRKAKAKALGIEIR